MHRGSSYSKSKKIYSVEHIFLGKYLLFVYLPYKKEENACIAQNLHIMRYINFIT